MYNLNNIDTAIVFGANRGIGFGLINELLEAYPTLKVIAAARSIGAPLKQIQNPNLECYQIDPMNEDELKKLSLHISEKYRQIDLMINSIGILHTDDIKPEKSLRDLNIEQLTESFKVNSLITPLIAKHFTNLFSKETLSVFATLSAKVGSISDNKIGGWYGYRASKAALNMFIKTIAIEYERKQIKTINLAIHPGTTITDLSKPYIQNTKYKLHEPIESARNILEVIESRNYEHNGCFYSWANEELKW